MLGEYNGDEMVSIHAPYIGSDSNMFVSLYTNVVSIHAPYIGSDIIPPERLICHVRFQSTLPT